MSHARNGPAKPIDVAWNAIRRLWTRDDEGVAKTVSLRQLGSVTVNVSCDFTGDTCLRANLLTKAALDRAPPGAVLEIATDNLASVETIPFMLPGSECVHLATVRTETGWKIYARRKGLRR